MYGPMMDRWGQMWWMWPMHLAGTLLLIVVLALLVAVLVLTIRRSNTPTTPKT